MKNNIDETKPSQKKCRPANKSKKATAEHLRGFCRQKGLVARFPLTPMQAKRIHLAFTGLTSIGATAEEHPQLFQYALDHPAKRMMIYLTCKALKNITRATLPDDLAPITLCIEKNTNNVLFLTLMSALRSIQAHPTRHCALYEAAVNNFGQAPTIISNINQLTQRGLQLETHLPSFLGATEETSPVKNITSLLSRFSITDTRQPAKPSDATTKLSDQLSTLSL